MSEPMKHPAFWFDDGSIIIIVNDHAFKVHKTLLSRHSRFFSNCHHVKSIEQDASFDSTIYGTITIDTSKKVRAKDVEALLEHLYHETSLFTETRYSHILSVLRVSGPEQLDFPSLHALAKDRLHSITSPFPIPPFQSDDLEEALSVAKTFEIHPMQKALYYHFVTSPEFGFDLPEPELVNDRVHLPGDPEPTANKSADADVKQAYLSQADKERCTKLMEHLIDHINPILFTPPPASHMACTDALAGSWMSLVVQPVIVNNGIHRPLETLESMKAVDWAQVGLCQGCAKEKHDEWTQEQQDIWRKMDQWLGFWGD